MSATIAGVLRLAYDGPANVYRLQLDGKNIAAIKLLSHGEWGVTIGVQTAYSDCLDDVIAWALYRLGVASSHERAETLAYAVTQAWWLGGDQ